MENPQPAESAKIEFRNYWVLLIDITGFSDRVSDREQRDNLARTYQDIVDRVLPNLLTVQVAKERSQKLQSSLFKKFGTADGVREISERWRKSVRIFSDSIFAFFGKFDHNPAAASFAIGFAADEISAELWKSRLPHRGAIAFGECHIDTHRDIFLGTPIVEAHRWEQAQKWLGISIAPAALKHARTEEELPIEPKPFEADVAIPTQEGEVTTWAINPFTRRGDNDENRRSKDAVLRGFLDCARRAEHTGNANVVSKYVNTARKLIEWGLESPRLKALAGLPRQRSFVTALNDNPDDTSGEEPE
jgi:hypothetical protein